MISYQRLPGRANQESLDGISDWFGMPTWVRSYWATVKNKIKELQGLGYEISLHQQKLGVAKSILVARNDRNQNALDDEIKKVQDDLDKWWKVKGYIDNYLPQWMQLDNNATIVQPTGVGVVPFVLAGAALIALSYTVTTGMALLQDYALKRSLTADVIAQKITSGQAADILSVPRSEGILEKVVSQAGMGIGIGLPTALLIGGGLYLLFTTGMLKGLLGIGSTQSSS